MIEIEDGLTIPEAELSFAVSRGGGPGGQHVNKTSNRVTLSFDVRGSTRLDDEQKRRIERRLATRVNKEGVLRLHVHRHRSLAANRELAIARFAELLREALRRRPPRRRTRPSRGAVEKRLREKRFRARLKRRRAGDADD